MSNPNQPISEFEKATTITADAAEPGLFHATIPDQWQQGKGAFGGLVIGVLARAILASEDASARRLRSLSADIPAPTLPGPVTVHVTTLRRGASMTYLDAQLLQDGAVMARASASLAAARAVTPVNMKMEPPAVRPPWSDVPVVPVAPPFGPVFGQKYEYRSTGPLPFAGGKEALAEGWIRERSPRGGAIDEPAIMGLLDAYWPTSFAIESAPRGVATVGYTMQLLTDPRTLPPDEPLFYRARGVAGAESFFVEMRELWSGDAVVALNQQTFALLG